MIELCQAPRAPLESDENQVRILTLNYKYYDGIILEIFILILPVHFRFGTPNLTFNETK